MSVFLNAVPPYQGQELETKNMLITEINLYLVTVQIKLTFLSIKELLKKNP